MRPSFITATDLLLMVNVFAEPLIFFFFVAPDRSCAAGVKARTSSPTLIRPWLMLPQHCLKKKKKKILERLKATQLLLSAYLHSPFCEVTLLANFFFFFVDKHPWATLKVSHLFHLTSCHWAAEGFIRHVTRFSSRWKEALQALGAGIASIQDGSSAFAGRDGGVFHRVGHDSAFLRVARRLAAVQMRN